MACAAWSRLVGSQCIQLTDPSCKGLLPYYIQSSPPGLCYYSGDLVQVITIMNTAPRHVAILYIHAVTTVYMYVEVRTQSRDFLLEMRFLCGAYCPTVTFRALGKKHDISLFLNAKLFIVDFTWMMRQLVLPLGEVVPSIGSFPFSEL